MCKSLLVLLLVVLLVLLGACTRARDPELANPGVSPQKGDCPLLPRGCAGTPTSTEGCPDAILPVGDGCMLASDSVVKLTAAAREMLETPELTKLRVVAPSLTCANIARAHLEAHGVPEGRVSVAAAANRTFVSFEVEAWNERDCRSGAPSKLPLGK
ncbi:MAG: hypothetical protein HYV09_25660 [Deltaproteobacteria bacterium]|nr:hypothetical protein [Deltaproteobacteria bacterium]